MVAVKSILAVICTILLSVESWNPLKWLYIGKTDYEDGVCRNTQIRILDTMNVTFINPVRIDKNCYTDCDYKNETLVHKHEYYEDIQADICCPKYYPSKKLMKCLQCNVQCKNAWCSSSNTCVCEVGYVKFSDDDFTCYPAACKRNCINGICAEKDQCVCKKNYILDSENKYSCIPICEAGFQRNPKEKSKCERGCYPPCKINAACEAGKCACLDGYDNVNDSCVPRCRPCTNGKICVAPHNCSCPRGFIDDNQDNCIPECKPECSEGICTAPDVCTPFCTIKCESDGQCRIQEKCVFDKTVIEAHNREKCFNPAQCLVNCKCKNRECVCDQDATTSTTSETNDITATAVATTLFKQPYSSPPDIQTRIGDFSDSEMQTDSSNSVVIAAVTVVLVLGIAAAAGMVIRKRSKKSGRRVIQNDIYRMQNSPGVNAVDIDNEIYEETNEYQVIAEK